MTVLDIVFELVDSGISVTIKKDHLDGIIKYDLNPGAKNEMELFVDPWTSKMMISRCHGYVDEVKNTEDVVALFKGCLCTGTSYNEEWTNILKKYNQEELLDTFQKSS